MHQVPMTYKKPDNKMYYFLAVLFILTLAIVIYIVRHQTNSIISDLTFQQAQTANQAFYHYLQELGDRVLTRVEFAAKNESIIKNLEQENYELLGSDLRKLDLGIDFAGICDENGIIIARMHSGLTGDDVSGHQDISFVMRTGQKSGSISIVPTTGSLAVSASAPVYDGGRLLGIINCNYDLTKNEYVDAFRERTGCEAAIFLGDTRISSTAKDQFGSRNTGLAADEFIAETVLRHKQNYLGELELNGKMYGACYSPLVSGGEVIGMLFTGIDIEEILGKQRTMNYWIILSVIIGIAATVLFMTVSSIVSKKYAHEIEKELKQQVLMASISRSFLSDADIDTLLTNTLGMIGEFMEIPQALFFRLDEDEKNLTCSNEWINPALEMQSRIGSKLPLMEPMLSIITGLKPGVGKDSCLSSNDPVFKKAMSPYRVNFKNYITTPVFIKGRMYAVIDFSREDDGRDWNESEISLVTLFASTLSGVFERDAMERQTSIVERSPYIIFYSDLNGTLAYTNPAASVTTGYTRDEIIAGGMNLIFDEKTVQDIKKIYIPLTLANGSDHREFVLRCKNGSARILEINSFIAEGGIVAAIAIDLTETRALESELITAKNQAEKASRAKSEFLSRMSHEMRTPMNAIIGLTDLAMETDEMQKIKSYLGKTGGASKHLLGIINDILDMTSIESGHFDLVYGPFSLEKMIIDAVNIVDFNASQKKQNLSVQIDDQIPTSIISDEQQLRKVVINLLLNAVKFTPPGGNINLGSKVTNMSGENYVIRIWIEDNGIGIAPEAQGRLFQPFEQADGGVTRKYGGTGLGLFISKKIIEQMGGKIWVESEPGRGSKFSFTIIVKRENTEIRPEDSGYGTANAKDGKKNSEAKTILMAEDVEINRYIVQEMLADVKLKIECAENGKQAVEMFTSDPEKYSLILMDINMPEMDGYTATHKIRVFDESRKKRIPVIAMTANVYQEDIEKCLEAGMDDHIGKPVDIEDLINKIDKYIGPKNSIRSN